MEARPWMRGRCEGPDSWVPWSGKRLCPFLRLLPLDLGDSTLHFFLIII